MPGAVHERRDAEQAERRDGAHGSRSRCASQAATTSAASGGSASAASTSCVAPRPAAPETTASSVAGGAGERRQPQPGARSRYEPRFSSQAAGAGRAAGAGSRRTGRVSKLCGGGGEVVYHSSVSPSHGSLPTRRAVPRARGR